jgi:hypothetical protein
MRLFYLALLAGVGCAGTQGWAENRTRNVTLYTNASIEHEFIQEWLQRSYTAYSTLFPDTRPGNVTAVWLKDQPGSGLRFFSPFDDPQAGWTLETVPQGRIGHDGLIVLERREVVTRGGPVGYRSTSIRDENVAKRQMAHFFVMKALPNAPLWLQIGLGRYLARYRVHYKGKDWIACFGSPVFDEPIVAGGSGGQRVLVEVGELFDTDWYKYDEKLRTWYEYTAYALVHYMVHGENGYNATRFPIFIKALKDNKSVDDALALAYPHVLPDEWDAKLDDWVHPPASRTLTATNRNIVQGLCRDIPAEHDSDFKAERRPADPREIAALMDDLERVEPFRRHATWMPTDVVEAEAAKRPARHRNPTPGATEPGEVPGQSVPTISTPARPPQ